MGKVFRQLKVQYVLVQCSAQNVLQRKLTEKSPTRRVSFLVFLEKPEFFPKSCILPVIPPKKLITNPGYLFKGFHVTISPSGMRTSPAGKLRGVSLSLFEGL